MTDTLTDAAQPRPQIQGNTLPAPGAPYQIVGLS